MLVSAHVGDPLAVAASRAFHPTHLVRHTKGCQTRACDRRVGRWWWARHRPPVRLGPVQEHVATFYSIGQCDHGLGSMTASGATVHFGVIASDYLPLGTKLRMETPIMGRRDFEVLDTGASFDVWLPCPKPIPWGNPTLRFRIVG